MTLVDRVLVVGTGAVIDRRTLDIIILLEATDHLIVFVLFLILLFDLSQGSLARPITLA